MNSADALRASSAGVRCSTLAYSLVVSWQAELHRGPLPWVALDGEGALVGVGDAFRER